MSDRMSVEAAVEYLRPIAESATVGHYGEALNVVLDHAREAEATLDRVRALADEIADLYKDQIGSHYAGCYQHHVVCLAVTVQRILGEGASDARD